MIPGGWHLVPAALPLPEALLLWSAVTIGLYLVAQRVRRAWPRWWTSPLILAPLALIAIIVVSGTSYSRYIAGTRWLIVLLGPATVAFAVPIWEQRMTIVRYWRALVVGIAAGSATAIVSAWLLASALSLDDALRLSLLPRSISTPFAMAFSGEIGGIPDLTALFVILTGVLGAAIGEVMLYALPLRSALARGAAFGMGAHAVGSNKAHQISSEEGAIASLVMVLAGVVNVLLAPLVAYVLR